MDWFLYDNGLRHERVKMFADQVCRCRQNNAVLEKVLKDWS